MTPEKILQEINTILGYNFHEHEPNFEMLTGTRYTNIEEIQASYFATNTGELFKITCEKVNELDLPKDELNNLKDYKERLEEDY